MLRENLCAVDDDVEHTAGTLNHLRFNACFGFDRCRQTGGFGSVVSLNTICDRNLHILRTPSSSQGHIWFAIALILRSFLVRPPGETATVGFDSLAILGRYRQVTRTDAFETLFAVRSAATTARR